MIQQVDAKGRRVTVTTAKGNTYTVAFDRISTRQSGLTSRCQSCGKVAPLHDVRLKLRSRGEPNILVLICGDCLVWMETGREG